MQVKSIFKFDLCVSNKRHLEYTRKILARTEEKIDLSIDILVGILCFLNRKFINMLLKPLYNFFCV
jgi:uncharacterized protein YggT (Ycf19 family)